MIEEIGTTEPAPVTEPVTAPVTEPAGQPNSFIDSEGTFTDGWRGKYLSEDIKEHGAFKEGRVKNVQGLLKSLASAESMIGADKVAKPSDSYGESDWEEWYNLGGRPQNATDYALNAPEGLPEGAWSDDRAIGYKELFHKIGLSAKQVEALSSHYNADLVQQLSDHNNAQETSMEELKNGLISDWGNAFEQKKHLGNLAIDKGVNGDAAFQERITQKFGTDPDFVRFASNIGSLFNESSSVSAVKVADTPSEVQDKIDEIMASPAFNDRKNPGHKAAIEKVSRLTKQKVSVKQPA